MRTDGPIPASLGKVSDISDKHPLDTCTLEPRNLFHFRLSDIYIVDHSNQPCPELVRALNYRGLEMGMVDRSSSRFCDIYCF